MAKVINFPGTVLCGPMGKAIDFYSWKGIQVCRSFPKYTYQRTNDQGVRRDVFAEAVASYQTLSDAERVAWRYKARGKKRSGYEEFLSVYLKTH